MHGNSAVLCDDGKLRVRLTPLYNDLFLLLLLAAQRITETAMMRVGDLDLDGAWWTIPRSKNGDPQRVYLVPEALEVLTRRLAALGKAARDPQSFVFSVTNGRTHAADQAGGKASFLSPRVDETGARLDFPHGLSFKFTAHDLRTTVGTNMGRLGVDRFHIACVLGHRSVTNHQVTAIYDQYVYDDEKQRALLMWSHGLRYLLAGESLTSKDVRVQVRALVAEQLAHEQREIAGENVVRFPGRRVG
jgi:integrase